MVSEEGYEEEWNEGDEWNDSHEGYWADDQNWNEGYWAYDDLYYLDEYGYFQKKGKGKGKGKGKARKARLMMAKEENQEMAKVSPTMFNLRPRRLLPYKTWYLFSVINMAILIIFGAWFRLRLTLLEALHPFREVLPGDLL